MADGQAAGLAWESMIGGQLQRSRASAEKEGAAGLLWAGYAGDGAARRSTSTCLRVGFSIVNLLPSSEHNNAISIFGAGDV